MNNLSEDDLRVFFEINNNRYVNPLGMIIGWTEQNEIWTFLTHQTYDQGIWEVSIATEFDSLDTFSAGFELKSFQDIDKLDYTSSWMRYLNGKAEIIINPMELEVPFSFRICNYKTIIFSLEKHFYDEVDRHLTMPEDFEEYFDQNEHLLFKISNRNI